MSHRSAVAGAPYPLLATDQVSSVDNLPDLRSYLKEHDLPDADNAVKLLQVFDVQKKSMETWSSDDYFSRLPRFSDISGRLAILSSQPTAHRNLFRSLRTLIEAALDKMLQAQGAMHDREDLERKELQMKQAKQDKEMKQAKQDKEMKQAKQDKEMKQAEKGLEATASGGGDIRVGPVEDRRVRPVEDGRVGPVDDVDVDMERALQPSVPGDSDTALRDTPAYDVEMHEEGNPNATTPVAESARNSSPSSPVRSDISTSSEEGEKPKQRASSEAEGSLNQKRQGEKPSAKAAGADAAKEQAARKAKEEEAARTAEKEETARKAKDEAARKAKEEAARQAKKEESVRNAKKKEEAARKAKEGETAKVKEAKTKDDRFRELAAKSSDSVATKAEMAELSRILEEKMAGAGKKQAEKSQGQEGPTTRKRANGQREHQRGIPLASAEDVKPDIGDGNGGIKFTATHAKRIQNGDTVLTYDEPCSKCKSDNITCQGFANIACNYCANRRGRGCEKSTIRRNHKKTKETSVPAPSVTSGKRSRPDESDAHSDEEAESSSAPKRRKRNTRSNRKGLDEMHAVLKALQDAVDMVMNAYEVLEEES